MQYESSCGFQGRKEGKEVRLPTPNRHCFALRLPCTDNTKTQEARRVDSVVIRCLCLGLGLGFNGQYIAKDKAAEAEKSEE